MKLTTNSISVPSSSMTTMNVSAIDKVLPLFATIWFFVSIDSIFVWNPFTSIIHIFAALGVIWGSMLSKSVSYVRKYRLLSILMLCYLIWLMICFTSNFGNFIKRISIFAPLLFILFWSKELLTESYTIIRKVVIFFAIGASIVSILSLAGLISKIPHFVFPPQESLHERLGYVYYVYGLFVTIQDPAQMLIYRACGMMKEPGHFAVILGFIYLIDRYQGQKINLWLVLCGILTFSSNFVLIALFTELHNIFRIKNVKKIVKWVLIAIFAIYIIYLFLPSDIQDQIYYLIYGRNLEKVMDILASSSSINEALDERASDLPLAIYNKMTLTEMMVGVGTYDSAYCLSDYRGMIMAIGWIGTVLSIFSYLFLIRGSRKAMACSLLMTFVLIMMHRSWMLYFPYVYFLSMLAVVTTSPQHLYRYHSNGK